MKIVFAVQDIEFNGVKRCRWCNMGNPLYVAYHDHEWGVPVHDDKKLFEMLVLELFQAGLSWECILNKREAFREAFDGFDYCRIALYDEVKVQSLLQDKSIVRNRMKIKAAIINARVFQEIQMEYGSFGNYIWSFTDGNTIVETGLASSSLSDAISKDLKCKGMKFVGSTVIYAYSVNVPTKTMAYEADSPIITSYAIFIVIFRVSPKTWLYTFL